MMVFWFNCHELTKFMVVLLETLKQADETEKLKEVQICHGFKHLEMNLKNSSSAGKCNFN